MTLDSVVPMDLALGQEHAPMLDRAVERVMNDCEADSTCRETFPDRGEELSALFARLREEPQRITIIDPRTGEPRELLLTAETLAVAIRFLSYASETQALLPLLVHEALSTGRLERLASQALLVMDDLTQMIARGMELSVMCAEDYPAIDFGIDYADTMIGNIMLESIRTQCEIWPRGELPADFREPRASAVPTLLLSGERDPVTPPEYAARTAEAYPNHLNLVARGQSHSVLRNPCLQDIATAFVEAGSVEGLDTSCTESIGPSPFFTTLLGPEP
jgi:pimeloyl-ACP methyl ester carboxylesterase